MDPTLISLVPLAIAVIGTVVWSVRQEGRINAHAMKFDEREKQDEIRERSDEARFNEIIRRLDRIERKQDAVNGNGVKH